MINDDPNDEEMEMSIEDTFKDIDDDDGYYCGWDILLGEQDNEDLDEQKL
jgi:hypothetical protein